ncbi:hypothetical protein C7H19_13195 [Aphanothece hegewaldii CCALA 016]|uniref:histidine kinase n=1 Tax=Aphanothece hegewaldii CCALA 016 TaxID=2107694 RepID=A0A2T1LWU4_9CHRO|nr:HAMP domain-containing sensor histidine kinase [Aphanothece hegewaldii]PSF36631.1 hypothetical protein C7H19_13195 [Aphanothece hegewaldii CCALA 016]
MEIPKESEDLEKQLIDLLYSYSSPNFQTILREIAQKCSKTLKVDTCLIISGVSVSETIQVGFWHKNNIEFSLSESFLCHPEISTILARKQPCTLSNDLAQTLSVKTLLGIRTEFQDKVNGLIIIGKTKPQVWKSEEHNQLIQASKYVSIGSAMNTQSQKENNPAFHLANFNRGTSIAEIPMIKRFYDLTRQQLKQQRYLLEQQRQLNDKKNEIITAISDKARNPLATMKMAIDLLSNTKNNIPLEKQEKYWNILRHEWNNINELINSIVTLDQLESKEIVFQPQLIKIATLIQNLEETFNQQWLQEQHKPLKLKIEYSDSPKQIQTDLQHLESILQELLTNAVHFSEGEQTIYLKFAKHYLDKKDAMCITITNIGIGIPDTEKESIYEPFYRGKGVIEKGISGTGVGLAVVKGLVELLGGTIEMQCEPMENTENYITSFTLILPLKPDHNISAS